MVNLDVEFCPVCGHETHYDELKEVVLKRVPETKVTGIRGRQGSFEIEVNKTLIYSKLRTMAFPDNDEIADIVEDVANGKPVRVAHKQQPINCCIM